MHILNFAHPLTEAQLADIRERAGRQEDAVTDVPVQFDQTQPFVPQVVTMLDNLEITSTDWQTESWLVVLPALNYIAGVLLAELHGRTGHFPAIVRLRPLDDPLGTSFELAEIINLEQVRQEARGRR